MIDWSKEKATQNYCGYCGTSPTSSKCDGTCFKKEENRVDHILEMIERIPEEIKILEDKLKDYKNELTTKNKK